MLDADGVIIWESDFGGVSFAEATVEEGVEDWWVVCQEVLLCDNGCLLSTTDESDLGSIELCPVRENVWAISFCIPCRVIVKMNVDWINLQSSQSLAMELKHKYLPT